MTTSLKSEFFMIYGYFEIINFVKADKKRLKQTRGMCHCVATIHRGVRRWKSRREVNCCQWGFFLGGRDAVTSSGAL